MVELTLDFTFSMRLAFMSNDNFGLDPCRQEIKDVIGHVPRDAAFQSSIRTLKLRINLKKPAPIYRALDDIKDEIKRYPNLRRVEIIEDEKIGLWSSAWWTKVKQNLVEQVGGDGRSGRPTIEFSSATWAVANQTAGWEEYSVRWTPVPRN